MRTLLLIVILFSIFGCKKTEDLSGTYQVIKYSEMRIIEHSLLHNQYVDSYDTLYYEFSNGMIIMKEDVGYEIDSDVREYHIKNDSLIIINGPHFIKFGNSYIHYSENPDTVQLAFAKSCCRTIKLTLLLNQTEKSKQ